MDLKQKVDSNLMFDGKGKKVCVNIWFQLYVSVKVNPQAQAL